MAYAGTVVPAPGASGGTHYGLVWDALVPIPSPVVATVAAGQTIAGNEQAFFYCPVSPGAYLFDLVISYTITGSNTTPPLSQVDIYNSRLLSTVSAVVGGISYLSAPFTITGNYGGTSINPQVQSARAKGLILSPDPTQVNLGAGQDQTFWNNYSGLALGSVFSVRATTVTNGSITNLQAYAIMAPTNQRNYAYS